MPVTMKLVSAGLSDVGIQRRNNEDRIHLDPDRGIFLVVDGLGGHNAGERASAIAVEEITARLERQTGSAGDRIREAITLANNAIFREAQASHELYGMACVVTVAVVEDDQVIVGHVGDSRLYLLEPGNIGKLTHDHSPVGEREDSGELPEREAMLHPRRNEVYRDLGTEEHTPADENFIEVLQFPFRPTSALLLCSDGLSDQVTAGEIRAAVEADAGRPQNAVRALVEAANRAGGKDNVSVVLVEGPEYARAVRPHRNNPTGSSGLLRWVASFILGVALAAGLFAWMRPHWIETPDGMQLAFGSVRMPSTLLVGPRDLATIGEAMALAQPGDTILVEPGVYRESIRLRSGIDLVSRQARGATLEGQATVVSAESVRDAAFIGFRIAGTGAVGIRLIDSDVDVSGVEISGMLTAGIEIGGASGGSIQAARIAGNAGPGILIGGASRTLIAHNVVTANGLTQGSLRPGVRIVESASPVLSGNVISGNGAEQIWISALYNGADLATNNVISPVIRNPARQIKVIAK
jgi:serine/threonine protein phosphatase PrpC